MYTDSFIFYCCFFIHLLDLSLFSEYNPKDRVNPNAQLDPKTGKSLDYHDKTKGYKDE
jgi:hypothetical protein